MISIDDRAPPGSDDDFMLCRREARNFLMLWVVQSGVMIGTFLVLGYWRTDDQLGFPLGLPTWYWAGAIIPSFVFLAISIVMALRMREVNLK